MSKTEYAIFIVLVFITMTGAFFYATSEENWEAGKIPCVRLGKGIRIDFEAFKKQEQK